jgi:hypothetical protein
METATLKKYIDHPSLLNEETLQDIQDMVAQYPWFHTGHMLLLKNLKNINSTNYENQLKRSAAHVNNRKLLYQLITDVDKTQETEKKATEEAATGIDMHAEENKDKTAEKSDIKRTSADMQKNISDRLNFEQQLGDDETEKNIDDVMEPSVESVVDPGYHERNDDETLTIDKNQKITKKESHESDADEIQADKPTDYGLLDFEYNLENLEKDAKDKHVATGKPTKKDKLIDKFIQEEPRINTKAEKTDEDFSVESIKENSDLFTETLANIYIKQENYSKAIYIYEQLSLKYPQKSAYFAEQIKKTKKHIK